ncbi:MAG: hypothetical protein LC790_00165 [Actinobacteria bacterium]|nr:hypothetical protein [Actinomycetota bacterium]
MTPIRRRAVALTVALFAGVPTAAADAKLLVPPGPWPAPVLGASNPLAGTPLAFNGADATPNASLRVWLPVGASRQTVITRAFGGQTVVRGRLSDRDSNRSISGAAVQIAAHNGNAGDWYLTGVARTNYRGAFRAVLPAGPTRRVAALYWPHITASIPVFSRRLLVRTSARVYLKTSMLAGRRIVYRGRVSGAPIPPGGLLVAAQVRNGPTWATVRLVRTYASGRFVARYRFKHTGRRFQVRARVPSQPAWPLYSGQSHTQRVRSG